MNLPAPPPALETGNVWRIDKPPAHKVVRPYKMFLRGSKDPDLIKALDQQIPIYCLPIHSTDVRRWQNCRRYYLFAHRLGLKPVHEYRPAYKRGEWFHSTVESWLVCKEEMRDGVDAITLCQDVRDAMNDQFDNWWADIEKLAKDGVLPDGAVVEDFKPEAKADFLKAREMGIVFARDLGIAPAEQTARACEQQIYAKVKTVSRPLAGRLDLTTRDPAGLVWIADHKSTSDQPMDVIASLALDFQNSHYRLLAQARYPSSRVAGIIHNVVQTPSIRYSPKVKDKAGPEHYGERVTEWYANLLAEGEHVPEKRPAVRGKTYFGATTWPPPSYMHVLREVAVASHTRPILSRFPECGDSYKCRGANTSRRYPCTFLPLCREECPKDWNKHMPKLFVQQTLEEMERDHAKADSRVDGGQAASG
jgi:hypothetical protein